VHVNGAAPAITQTKRCVGCAAALHVAGKTFGVAKNVTLHAVRVLDCDGTAQLSALLKVRL
jgi:hypothetical protein